MARADPERAASPAPGGASPWAIVVEKARGRASRGVANWLPTVTSGGRWVSVPVSSSSPSMATTHRSKSSSQCRMTPVLPFISRRPVSPRIATLVPGASGGGGGAGTLLDADAGEGADRATVMAAEGYCAAHAASAASSRATAKAASSGTEKLPRCIFFSPRTT